MKTGVMLLFLIAVLPLQAVIVFDMDGDRLLQASKGKWLPHNPPPLKQLKLRPFDINGDFFDEMVDWCGPNDGLLVMNYKSAKRINGKNLIAQAGGYANGFEKLSAMDTNKDAKLTDKELKNLGVWQDKNDNAKVDKGEIKSLAALNITVVHVLQKNMTSAFVQNGKLKGMWDWTPVFVMVKKTRDVHSKKK